jgi:L-alanine-DL-glutamate epimerase-like enolase superfamily enzyme
MPNSVPPVYACAYSDQPQDLGPDGCVSVPDGPGLGVTYDWDVIERNRVSHVAFRSTK